MRHIFSLTTKGVGIVQSGLIIILSNVTCSHHGIAANCSIVAKQQSPTHTRKQEYIYAIMVVIPKSLSVYQEFYIETNMVTDVRDDINYQKEEYICRYVCTICCHQKQNDVMPPILSNASKQNNQQSIIHAYPIISIHMCNI